jgi:purine nucleosidase/pyrimidine-specific ribonucleoside hydrolase
MKQTPIVLDCDPGHDDALAMILAAHNPAINLLAITTVSGNGIIAKVTQNALSICALAKINVPVAQGAGNAILGQIEAATDIHGETALDGAPLPAPTFELEKISGVDLIAKVVREHPEKVTLVATGPLTNIALFLKLYPELRSNVAEIIFIGGSAARGNRTPYAEFNIWMDPEAADVVLKSGLPLTMCGLDVTHQALVTKPIFAKLEAMGTDLSKTVIGLLKFFASTYNDVFEMPDPPLHDPVVIAFLIDRSVVKTRRCNVEIELNGKFTRGATVVDIYDRNGFTPNVDVALELDFDKFWSMMLDAIEKAGKA